MIRRINEYFFPLEDDENLSFHDGFWFYGILSGAVIMTIILMVAITW